MEVSLFEVLFFLTLLVYTAPHIMVFGAVQYVYEQFMLYVNINKLYTLLYDVTPHVPETEKGFVDLLFSSSSSVNPQFITSINK